MTNLIWLQGWYKNQCNEDWEHDYGIKIETLDNPGWSVKIETEDSLTELDDFDWIEYKISEQDWFYYRVKDRLFEGAGDPDKLENILSVFKELVSNQIE